jgi:hypothetical protein
MLCNCKIDAIYYYFKDDIVQFEGTQENIFRFWGLSDKQVPLGFFTDAVPQMPWG